MPETLPSSPRGRLQLHRRRRPCPRARAPPRACRHGWCGSSSCTCSSVLAASVTPRRLRVSSTFGASWRSAFRSRMMPLPFSAEPIRTGTICPARSSAARSEKTLSRGGWMSSSSCSISASSWSARRSSIVKRASSRRATSPGIELDHLARRMLAVDEGAVEREIDEAGGDLVLPDRDLAQHQRRSRKRAAASPARRARRSTPCRSCSGTGNAGCSRSSRWRSTTCSAGIFFSSGSATTIAASTPATSGSLS